MGEQVVAEAGWPVFEAGEEDDDGASCPRAQPPMINNPPTIPVGERISPMVTYAKAAPQTEVLVMSNVSSVADTTFNATVSRYNANAVDTNPVQTSAPTMNGLPNQSTHCSTVGISSDIPTISTNANNVDPAATAESCPTVRRPDWCECS